jgi:magnesium transporter
MITLYAAQHGSIEPVPYQSSDPLPPGTVWIDLDEPTLEEEHGLEAKFGIDIPTREEMRQLEVSHRFYELDGTVFMTLRVVWRGDSADPMNADFTCVVRPECLITVRYSDPKPVATFAERARRGLAPEHRGDVVFVELLDTFVERAADLLERIGEGLDDLTHEVFRASPTPADLPPQPEPRRRWLRRRSPKSDSDLQDVIRRIGQYSDLASKLRESLHSFSRAIPYLEQAARPWLHPALPPRLRAIQHDVAALNEQDSFLAYKIDFLLNATLGLINIEQNTIIKIFSVVAVLLMPPTLVASIYGMNFKHMPELEWVLGYPWALVVMLAAGVLPYAYFKYRRWF